MNLCNSAQYIEKNDDWDILFAELVWNIWIYRNAVAFDNPLSDESSALERSLHWLDIKKRALEKVVTRTLTREQRLSDNEKWKPPSLGWFKVNSDGDCCKENGLAKCGGVIRNHMVETDSLETVQVIKHGKDGTFQFTLLHIILELMQRNWVVKFQYVSRLGNQVADGMTKLANRWSSKCKVVMEAPKEVKQMLQEDQHNSNV
ncbi:hypothetical protein F3Y22_tig00116962pilonHSYRG00075 [Hibiscus syriacus]|uniref:RNase H type-1 domain-containing protein n=1 Tax=Hibiscus syriacus TaxID=106335 RepID=A0A6A2WJP1_HIBSY|nr:hypothetical protein F3Y22_tig00116962pilonHSYRG00075 [Hibiscus syriacus]